jgi:DNA-binding LacI/PurR family transcriptional regulator
VASARNPSRRPTLVDVAAEAGVSLATASRALGDSPLVTDHTRRRVLDAAERLHFQPNRLARSLRRGATMTVGLVVPDVAAAFYAAALKAAQEVLQAAGYHVLVINTERAAERERDALHTLRAHQVDGLLVATSGGYEDIGVPTVFFDNVPAEGGACVVASDNEHGLSALVGHLAGTHGHRRIAYVGPPEAVGEGARGVPNGVGRERLDAFRAAVGRAGLPLPPEYVATSDVHLSEPVARELAHALIALPEPPTAVVAGVDRLAVGILRGLRDRGRRVPDDVALVSFDEPVSADLLDPPVTALARHDAELGRRAAELLVALLAGRPTPDPPVVRLRSELRARRSCGCAGLEIEAATM